MNKLVEPVGLAALEKRDPKVELLGRRLRRLRKDSKLGPAEFAARVGIDAQDLARIERGELRMGIEILLRMLAEFRIDPRQLAQLATGEVEEPDEPTERFRRNLSSRY